MADQALWKMSICIGQKDLKTFQVHENVHKQHPFLQSDKWLFVQSEI